MSIFQYGHGGIATVFGMGKAIKPAQPFSKSSDDIVNLVLRKIVGEKCRQLRQVQIKSQPRNQSLVMSSNIQLTDKREFSRQLQQHDIGFIRSPFQTHDNRKSRPRQMQQMMMMEMIHQDMEYTNPNSIKYMQKSLDRRIIGLVRNVLGDNLESMNQTISFMKLSIRNKYTEQFGMLQREVKKQYEKFKKSQNLRTTDQYVELLDSSLGRMLDQLQNKVEEFFKKCEEMVKKIKGKHQNKLDELEGKMKKIANSYFDITRTKLINVTIIERLNPFQGINIRQYNEDRKLPINEMSDIDKSGLSSKYNIIFNQKSFTGLKESGWLHNSVIDNYIQYLKETRNYNTDKSQCGIYTSTESRIFDNPGSYRFNSGPIFTKYERVGLVTNVNNDHWFFIGVYPKDNKIVFYDSIAKPSSKYNQYAQKIRNFIRHEQKTYKVPQSFQYRQIDDNTTPKQSNGADCGIHVVRNITHFVQGNSVNQENKSIYFSPHENNKIRMALYHFMAYLFDLARRKETVRYDWLEYASRSAIIHNKKQELWSNCK